MVIENASAIEDIILNNLPQIITEKFGFFITLLKAVGIAFLAYFIYMIVKGVWNWKDRKRLKRIEDKIDRIEKKLNKIKK